LQGEREMAMYNMTLDKFELTGIPPLPRGEARVEVTFDINADGILRVSARDLYTDNLQKLRISPRFYGLSREEISRMLEEAQKYAESDKKSREEVEIGIKADNMVRAARQTIEEVDLNVDSFLVDDVEIKILGVQTALANGNSQQIKATTEGLEKAVKALYRETKDKKREMAKGLDRTQDRSA